MPYSIFDPINPISAPREGDLFKRMELHGHIFEIYYGYYEDFERENPMIDPMPIYPDFSKRPKYTKDGFPFVTKMQDGCSHFEALSGKIKECAECRYYQHGDELLGVCICPGNKRSAASSENSG